ncbi:hypothetical protein HDU88_002360 [Geranomyces variabilis]|nr:hypothetical protein HDU88_002360 [Geranomyces variabilis]
MKDKARSIKYAALTEDTIKPSDYAAVFFAFDGWFSLSLSEIADLLAFGGLQALWSRIGGTADDALAASQDADVRYLMRLNERAFDAHALLTFAEFPDVDMKLHYGEKMSVSDQAEKMERSGKTRVVGKKLDYLYRIGGSEHGCGENSGPEAKAHVVHAAENHLDLAKTSRSQARALGKLCPGQVDRIVVLYLQILDNAARFYILVQFAPELFIMREISDGSFPFPRKDQHTQHVVDLCQFFLVMRSVMRNIAEAIRRAPRKRTVRKFSDAPKPEF